MKYEEYEALINSAIQDADKAPEALRTVLDALKTDKAAEDAAAASIASYEKRVRDLQDSNVKLFLMQSQGGRKPNEPEPDAVRGIDETAKELRNEVEEGGYF